MKRPVVRHFFASATGGAIAFLILFLINKGEPNGLIKSICLGLGCAIGVFLAFRIKSRLGKTDI